VETRDLILIGVAAIVYLVLTRLLPGPQNAAVDRASVDSLVAQLTSLRERAETAEGWARLAEARAEHAEAKCSQLQAMMDNLLPATVNDRQTITALRAQVQERNQELDTLKAGLGIR
jgi:cytochrome c-type biogenesis protein CcmH/NrfG